MLRALFVSEHVAIIPSNRESMFCEQPDSSLALYNRTHGLVPMLRCRVPWSVM
jgi:hypothetical protein